MAEIAVHLATKMAEGLLRKLIDKSYDTVAGESSLLIGVKGEIKFIIDELGMINAFLRGAEEKQDRDWAAREWVKQVKQLAYTIEDCIDEFLLHLKPRSSNTFKSAMLHGARTVRLLPKRHSIASHIQAIKFKVEEVSNRRMRYGINEITNASRAESFAQQDPRAAALFVEDSQLVGLDEPRRQLVEWLLQPDNHLKLMAVVGAGGLGKTTIARKAYESPDVTGGEFTCSAWVTVSQSYNLQELLKDMLKQFGESEGSAVSVNQLNDKLRDFLEDKSYVIVYDDIWKIDALRNLKNALPENNRRSRVILTTRNKEVARFCDLCEIYEPKKLGIEQSMTLFCTRVFNDPYDTRAKELMEPSKLILQKCDGLPLAIVSIAGVLASKPNKTSREWNNIIGRLGSELEINPQLEGMKQVLSFSYNDLPYHLKHCYLYLSKFPEDYLIKSKRIQRLWIVEGLVGSRRDMTAEEVAESYINELTNRSMILPSAFSANGKVKSFKLHDIMLELIVSKSMEENFVTLIRRDNRWIPEEAIRRLCIHNNDIPVNVHFSKIRSLTEYGDTDPSFISHTFKLLRVLDLEDSNKLNNEHLNVVSQLLHLKYLSLMNTRVSLLPKSIKHLRNLEFLDVRRSLVRIVPAEIHKLQQLQFLRMGDWKNPSSSSSVKLLSGLSQLRNLQELSVINGQCTHSLEELGMLTKIRKLEVNNLHDNDENPFSESLKQISNSLCSLKLHTDESLNSLTTLSATFPQLENLALSAEISELPGWVSSATNLMKIHLQGMKLSDEAMTTLGELPSLIKLHLGNQAYCGQSLCFGAQGFRNLKMLHINAYSLKSLRFEEAAVASLESLSIVLLCDALDEISGIKHLSNLKIIELVGPKTSDLDKVKVEVREHPNHPGLTVKNYSEDE